MTLQDATPVIPPDTISDTTPDAPVKDAIVGDVLGFCGLGANFTTNPEKGGEEKSYTPISYEEIQAMADDPQKVIKKNALWCIFSSHWEASGSRFVAEQREHGSYNALWFDWDTDTTTLRKLVNGLNKAIGRGYLFEAYTSKSATEEHQKARIIIPTGAMSPADYKRCMKIFSAKMKELRFIPDSAPASNIVLPCFLPNAGKFYTAINCRKGKTFNPLEHWRAEVEELEKSETPKKCGKKIPAAENSGENNPAQNNLAAENPARVNSGSSPIDRFNAAHTCEAVLLSHGYKQVGDNFLRPDSKSGEAKVSIHNGRAKTFGPSDPIYHEEHSRDAFDLETILKYGGDESKHLRAIREKSQPAKPTIRPLTHAQIYTEGKTPNAGNLSVEILKKFNGLGWAGMNTELLNIDHLKLKKIINSAFWMAEKSRIFALSPDGNMNIYSEGKAYQYLSKETGCPIDYSYFSLAVVNAGEERNTAKIYKACVIDPIIGFFIMYRQRKALSRTVDMFTTESIINTAENQVEVIHKHKKLVARKGQRILTKINMAAVDDYKQHFPQFDEILEQIVAAVFASDRKKAYLWVHCETDWGKTFFKDLLRSVGVVQTLAVEQVSQMAKGQPVAIESDDFLRCWAVAFEELSHVTAAVRQLEKSITVSPKFQMATTVPVYQKIFFSADEVESLRSGSDVVEDQLANRFAYIQAQGKLGSRPLFSAAGIGKGAYFSGIAPYVAKKFNGLVDMYIAMGAEKATYEGDKRVEAFHKKYAIAQDAGKMAESLKDIAQAIALHAQEESVRRIDTPNYRTSSFLKIYKDRLFILLPSEYTSRYLENHYSKSERIVYGKKSKEIRALICDSGKSATSQRYGKYKSERTTCLRVRKEFLEEINDQKQEDYDD